MPLYEYECKECGRRTEKIQKFSDAPLTVCPHCGGPIERTLTAPAVQFKGGGWYKDLYSSAKPAASSNGDAAKSGGKSGSDASKSTDSASTGTDGSSSGSTPAAPASTPATPSKS